MKQGARLPIILAVLALLCSAAPALADKRVALVIGNAAYRHTRTLPNPRNDADAIAKVLRGIGFEVTVRTDQAYGDMRRAIRDFGQSASGAEIAVIHFAGHGLELAGENYLLPIDAKVARDGDLEYEAVTLTSVLASVRGAAKLRLVILDACRNNPLGDRMALSAGATRAVARGLARIEPSGDVLVAYSAKHGTLAQDGDGPLSPYAEALVKHLATPGVDIRLVMGRVRDMVLERTARAQEPFVYGSIGGEMLALVPGHANDATVSQPNRAPLVLTSPPATAAGAEAEAAAAWATVKDSKGTAELEAFIKRYGATFHGDLARRRLDELQRVAMLAAEEQRKAVKAAAKKAAEEAEAEAQRRDPARGVEPGSGIAFRDCPDCPEMVVVPAGNFLMGSTRNEIAAASREYRKGWVDPEGWFKEEGPQLAARISKPFAVAKYSITRGEYATFITESGHRNSGEYDKCTELGPGGLAAFDLDWWRRPSFMQTDRHPVVCVNWHDAKAFVAWLSGKTNKNYRLLTETEREYVTRAGTTTRYWWGHSISSHQANYGTNGTTSVDEYAANPWGLFQVHGNVSEWTEDCWNDSHQGSPADGSSRTGDNCMLRVTRGGSWGSALGGHRAASRSYVHIKYGSPRLGFRIARTL